MEFCKIKIRCDYSRWMWDSDQLSCFFCFSFFFLKVNTELDRVETRRDNQDEIWKSKMENLEARYRADIEKLYSQLKSNEESADRMRIDYTTRINDLERREASVESELIQARNAKNNRSKIDVPAASQGEATDFFTNRSVREQRTPKKLLEEENLSDFESEDSSPEIRSPKLEKASKITEEIKFERHCENRNDRVRKKEINEKNKKLNSTRQGFREKLKNGDSKNRFSEAQRRKTIHHVHAISTKKKQPEVVHQKIEIASKNRQNINEKKIVEKTPEIDGNSASISDEESESSLESETSANSSQSELEQEPEEEKPKNHDRNSQKSDPRNSPFRFPKSKETGLEMFHSKLRDIGIDPEWRGIPDATFKQVFEIVRHHRNINSKVNTFCSFVKIQSTDVFFNEIWKNKNLSIFFVFTPRSGQSLDAGAEFIEIDTQKTEKCVGESLKFPFFFENRSFSTANSNF